MNYISYKETTMNETERKKYNEKYIKEKMIEYREYFNNMFKNIDSNIKLDEEQRKIILTDEKYLMIIAGAGAGKTTTIAAKVNYLIEKQKIKDNEIIIISFTNKAIKELDEIINQKFKHEVKILTFHKFGYEIIKTQSNQKPKIISNNENIIREYIEKIVIKDEYLAIKFYELYTYFFKTQKIYKKILKRLKKNKKFYKKKYNAEKLLEKIKNEKKYKEFIAYCKTFINLFKSKEYEYKDFNKIIIDNEKTKRFIEFIRELYIYYEKQLSKNNLVDFDDLITLSTKIIETKKIINQNYKYIIIDEYQDISDTRYKLIKTISDKMNSKIVVVGDDWQCIYSFAASNINLFIHFKKNVEYCEILKIQKTYRNSQQLINIAGKFIQKNSNQIKKQLISNKKLENPIIILKYKKNELTKKIIETIQYLIKKYGEDKNILILGRYTFDINKINNNEILKKEANRIIYKNKKTKIDFMTIHSAKGLGYDNVIIINTKNEKLGFPSKIQTDPILEQLITIEKTIKYPEERRLFYVALTRTKNEVILLTTNKNQSIFIKEIKKEKNTIVKSNINYKK